MPQLHVYVPDPVAREARRLAEEEGMSVSSYLARLLQRELGPGWPEGWFERVFGSWQGDPIERPPQGLAEERIPLDRR